MVSRIARKDNTELPQKFWEKDKWKRLFLLQIRHANSLLKLYSYEAIVKALRTPQGKKLYSLGAQWLDPLIKSEQEKIDIRLAAMAEQTPKEVEQLPTATDEKPREAFVRKPSPLSKLRGLD